MWMSFRRSAPFGLGLVVGAKVAVDDRSVAEPPLDLIVTMDDATGTIYSALLVEEEGTASTFRALKEVFETHGLPMNLYTDRGAHYFHKPKAGDDLDDQTAKELDRTAKKLGETRSGLIRKALREWLDKKTLGSPGWPSLILEWQGVPDTPPFESYRGELLPPREDTFS
jgi:hypothetical protein